MRSTRAKVSALRLPALWWVALVAAPLALLFAASLVVAILLATGVFAIAALLRPKKARRPLRPAADTSADIELAPGDFRRLPDDAGTAR